MSDKTARQARTVLCRLTGEKEKIPRIAVKNFRVVAADCGYELLRLAAGRTTRRWLGVVDPWRIAANAALHRLFETESFGEIINRPEGGMLLVIQNMLATVLPNGALFAIRGGHAQEGLDYRP